MRSNMTPEEYCDAIEDGKQLIITGESKYGPVRLTPGTNDFAVHYAPDRRWREHDGSYEVVEQSLGGCDRDWVEGYIEGCIAHDDIDVEVLPHKCDACNSRNLRKVTGADDIVCINCGHRNE